MGGRNLLIPVDSGADGVMAYDFPAEHKESCDLENRNRRERRNNSRDAAKVLPNLNAEDAKGFTARLVPQPNLEFKL